MHKFTDLPEYKNDLKNFKSKLNLLTNQKSIKRAKQLLTDFENIAAMIDEVHNPLNKRLDPVSIKDYIAEISHIRYELQILFKYV